ncbi:hypothetical protein EZS27_006105 [termite gut metagenome]|uniref:DUF2442 domain-containing protein n=1 Tax=termite gut metagenome TaxID=433724 RepID=A0A5J4SKD8_9ZZZZ
MKTLLEKDGVHSFTAEVTMITSHGILLYVNGHEYYLSHERFPWFHNANVADVLSVEMLDEESLRWESLDVDLHLDSLIHPEKYPLIAI